MFTNRDENFWDNYPSELNNTISPDEIKTFIGRILQYGYTGQISLNWRSQNEGGDKLAYAVATQLMIWETIVGERDSNFNKVDTGSYDAVLDSVSTEHPLYSQIMSYYNSISSKVKNHATLPSFFAKSSSKAQEIEMEWSGEEYVAELTDTNGVLDNYSFTANVTGINFSVSGNTLTITADDAPTDTVVITASKNNSQRMGVITWTDGTNNPGSGKQDVITYAQSVTDPVKGYLKCNPLADIKNMGIKDKRVVFWSPEEYEKFAYHAMNYPEYYYAYEVLYWCGLRQGEMFALTLDDVDLDERVIHVTKTYHRVNRQDVITTPKTPSSVRKVSMPAFLCDELKEYIAMLHEPTGDQRLFFALTKSNLTKNFHSLITAAGLKRITVHGLRHSHVSLLISKKYDIFEVSKRIGHKSVKTTQDIYGHLFDDVQKNIANDLDKLRRG